MKKTAVLIYNQFCNFEISVALEMFAMAEKPGAMDIREAIEDDEILSFIKLFDERKMIIGAISIAPILLVKNGIIGAKPFMAGVNKEDLFEEGFSEEDFCFDMISRLFRQK